MNWKLHLKWVYKKLTRLELQLSGLQADWILLWKYSFSWVEAVQDSQASGRRTDSLDQIVTPKIMLSRKDATLAEDLTPTDVLPANMFQAVG